jgi:hypothetical protein
MSNYDAYDMGQRSSVVRFHDTIHVVIDEETAWFENDYYDQHTTSPTDERDDAAGNTIVDYDHDIEASVLQKSETIHEVSTPANITKQNEYDHSDLECGITNNVHNEDDIRSVQDDDSSHGEKQQQSKDWISYAFGALGLLTFLKAQLGALQCILNLFCNGQDMPTDQDDVIALVAISADKGGFMCTAAGSNGGTTFISYVVKVF